MNKAADLKSQADPLPDKDQGPEGPRLFFLFGSRGADRC